MKAASAVLIDLRDPERGWTRAQQALALLVSGGLLAWACSHLLHGTQGLALAFTLLVTVLGLGLTGPLWRSATPRGWLVWNGVSWQWRADDDRVSASAAVDVRLALDLGAWILVALRPQAPNAATQWLPVSRNQAGPAWHGLQVALRQAGLQRNEASMGLTVPGFTGKTPHA